MTSLSKSIAFFGATGGSTAPVLAKSLKAGYTCTARPSPHAFFSPYIPPNNLPVARTPSKLTTLLETSHGITPDLISKYLTIITGDVKDPIPVSQTLFPASLNPHDPTSGNVPVDFIVSGIGCYPVMKKGNWLPVQEDPTLCEDALTTILNALRGRKPTKKPGLSALSTTGMSKYGRDTPLLTTPIYWMLHEAHLDKTKMEALCRESVEGPDAVVGRSCIVRASLLTGGKAKEVDEIRWDTEEEGKIAVKGMGYTISRESVGAWVFERVVVPFEGGVEEGTGKTFSISH